MQNRCPEINISATLVNTSFFNWHQQKIHRILNPSSPHITCTLPVALLNTTLYNILLQTLSTNIFTPYGPEMATNEDNGNGGSNRNYTRLTSIQLKENGENYLTWLTILPITLQAERFAWEDVSNNLLPPEKTWRYISFHTRKRKTTEKLKSRQQCRRECGGFAKIHGKSVVFWNRPRHNSALGGPKGGKFKTILITTTILIIFKRCSLFINAIYLIIFNDSVYLHKSNGFKYI